MGIKFGLGVCVKRVTTIFAPCQGSIFDLNPLKTEYKGKAIPEGSRRLRLPDFKTIGT
jgi:hypothetical protein